MTLGYLWHAVHGWVLTGVVVCLLIWLFLVP